MKICCHQPEYWPIPRLLAKWRAADLLVVLDNVDFDRESLQHRMKLQDASGSPAWATIPYVHAGTPNRPVPQQIRILEAHDLAWPEKHWATIQRFYKARAKPECLSAVEAWYYERKRQPASIAEAAWESMRFLATATHLETPWVFASALLAPPNGWGEGGARVLNICRVLQADAYLSGETGVKLLDRYGYEFRQAGIAIEVQAFQEEQGALAGLSGLHEYLTEGPEHLAYMTRRQP